MMHMVFGVCNVCRESSVGEKDSLSAQNAAFRLQDRCFSRNSDGQYDPQDGVWGI